MTLSLLCPPDRTLLLPAMIDPTRRDETRLGQGTPCGGTGRLPQHKRTSKQEDTGVKGIFPVYNSHFSLKSHLCPVCHPKIFILKLFVFILNALTGRLMVTLFLPASVDVHLPRRKEGYLRYDREVNPDLGTEDGSDRRVERTRWTSSPGVS